MNNLAKAALLASALAAAGCGYENPEKYCEALAQKAKQPGVQAELRSWIARNVEGKSFTFDKDVTIFAGTHPGYFSVVAPFEWEGLGMTGPMRRAALIGPTTMGDLDRPETVQAVFFGEFNGQGIVVRMPRSASFGIEDDNYKNYPIAADMVGICYERD